jgi:hypothetical protein
LLYVYVRTCLDPDVRNIIDKLAVFVARNGVEFEQMTMEKQRDNPKFHFLFGGESHAYYRWRVSQEQASLYGQQSQQPGLFNIFGIPWYTGTCDLNFKLTPLFLNFRDATNSFTNVATAYTSIVWCPALFPGPRLRATTAATATASITSGAGLLSPRGI